MELFGMSASDKPISNTDNEAIYQGLYDFFSKQNVLFGNID